MKVMTIFGTRPEAIKLAPIIKELQHRDIRQVICVTSQHREMLDQMLELFNIVPNYDLNIMTKNQTLEEITSRALLGLEPVVSKEKPDLIIVQGDTTTTLMGALVGFYHKVPVAHVEAGLRTDNKYNPFPEEMNRRLVTQLADLHLAATELAQQNLLDCGIDTENVFVTGNTVIDALMWTSSQNIPFSNPRLAELETTNGRIVLVTTHRRENLGDSMHAIFNSINRLSEEHKDVVFVFPVHLNPVIRKMAESVLGENKNVILIEPITYPDMAKLMKMSYMVMTDSGGIQEEAPSLGKPVLVLRTTTERPEGISAGTALLAGIDEDNIFDVANELLSDTSKYNEMARSVNPYGDGHAAEKIIEIISERFR